VNGTGVRLLAPLRVRDFALLWSGQTVSLAGDGIFVLALIWQALALGGARGLSLVLVVRFLPATALLLAGGVVSDRVSRRVTMLACDSVQALSLTTLAVLTTTHHLRLWHLVVAAAVAGAASGFFLPASTALVPEVLPRDLLVAANSLNTVSRLTTARLLGPVAGGFLVAAGGAGVAFGVDAVTFAVSATTLAALRLPSDSVERPPGGSLAADLREGVAYCLTRRWLVVSLAAFAVLNLAVSAPLAVLVPVYVTEHLHLDARALGLLFAVEGLAGGVAAVVASQVRAPRRYVVATHLAFAASGVSLAVMGVTGSLAVALACLAVVGFLLELGNVYWTTAVQEHVPNDLLGRVSSVDWLMSGSLIPVGMALAGAAAAATGAAPVFVAGGAATAFAATCAAVALRARDPAVLASAQPSADHPAA
jgi:MFS family permease